MPEKRSDNFDLLRTDGVFDVIVVGGGINGIGVFRELALQGLRVLLIERNDFCSGCSAAPSRMIHGGLRYLENGEFDLVRESLRERDLLLQNAPHMVRPLPTMIPITSVFSGLLNGAAGFFGLSTKPANRGVLPVAIGLRLYDWMTRKRRRLPRASFHGGRATFRRWPKITPSVKFSAIYHDAWVSYPERLGVEVLLDTMRLSPQSLAVNYAELATSKDGFTITDRETGSTCKVSARAVVNASGAWLDDVTKLLADSAEIPTDMVSGTKGSHVILENDELHEALDGHMMLFDNADGRVCILFPYLGKVLAGSTDIRVDAPRRVKCEPEEQDYILNAIRLVFPGISIADDDVVFSYSGIRPLPKSDHDFTGRISRGHLVHRIEGHPTQFCMVGGKWTTFRAFAEQAADAVLAELGKTRRAETADMAIGGGAEFAKEHLNLMADLVQTHGVTKDRATHLLDVYGTRASEVLSFCKTHTDDMPLDSATVITAAEIAFLIRHEFARGLGDLILRRTPLAITGQVSSGIIDRIAAIAADELDWDEARRARETEAMVTELEEFYGVSREMLEERSRERNKACV